VKRVKLTPEERRIEADIDKYIPVDGKAYDEIVRAIEARKKDAVLHIRLSSHDLSGIRRKAKLLGVKYQSFVAEILHRVAQA
jgi:predicted DNA binding CopG/RHH family protein